MTMSGLIDFYATKDGKEYYIQVLIARWTKKRAKENSPLLTALDTDRRRYLSP